MDLVRSIRFKEEIDSLLDNLKDKGYEEIDQPMLMRMLSSLVCSSIDSDDLVDVEPEALVQGMNILKTSVSAAVDFLEGQLKVKILYSYLFLSC